MSYIDRICTFGVVEGNPNAEWGVRVAALVFSNLDTTPLRGLTLLARPGDRLTGLTSGLLPLKALTARVEEGVGALHRALAGETVESGLLMEMPFL